jgi:hypothetical protein
MNLRDIASPLISDSWIYEICYIDASTSGFTSRLGYHSPKQSMKVIPDILNGNYLGTINGPSREALGNIKIVNGTRCIAHRTIVISRHIR